MNPQPQKEHAWLQKLVGEWTIESECSMGPDKPKEIVTGHDSVRSLGGLWVVGEWTCEVPGGGTGINLMSLGYDPAKQRFVGTFISSMGANLWIYDGELDATGKVLTLDAEGPSFTGDGTTTKYHDIIEWINDDYRTLSSECLAPDGTWQKFMTAHFRRK